MLSFNSAIEITVQSLFECAVHDNFRQGYTISKRVINRTLSDKGSDR